VVENLIDITMKLVEKLNVTYLIYKSESLLSGEDSPKQLLLINTQLVTRIIKFFD